MIFSADPRHNQPKRWAILRRVARSFEPPEPPFEIQLPAPDFRRIHLHLCATGVMDVIDAVEIAQGD
jgi:hypothetical protein